MFGKDIAGRSIAEIDRFSPYCSEVLRWQRLGRKGEVVQRIVNSVVQRGWNAVDIGASRGLFTAGLMRLVGREGLVDSFEPNPSNVNRLRSFRRHGAVSIHDVALSDSGGVATLSMPVRAGVAFDGMASLEDVTDRVPGSKTRSFEVKVARLDDELGDNRFPDFIKCDVEGHEDSVFRGGGGLVLECPLILVELEERHRKNGIVDAFEFLSSNGRVGWAVGPEGLRPLEDFDLERDQQRFAGWPAQVMPAGYINDFFFAQARFGLDRFASR